MSATEKTLATIGVGDKVVVRGGGWNSRDSIATVDRATPKTLTVGGVVFRRDTGRGPAPAGKWDFRQSIRVATDDDVRKAARRDARRAALHFLRQRNWEGMQTDDLLAVAEDVRARQARQDANADALEVPRG